MLITNGLGIRAWSTQGSTGGIGERSHPWRPVVAGQGGGARALLLASVAIAAVVVAWFALRGSVDGDRRPGLPAAAGGGEEGRRSESAGSDAVTDAIGRQQVAVDAVGGDAADGVRLPSARLLLRGRVFDAQDGTALSGASLQLETGHFVVLPAVLSGAEGAFEVVVDPRGSSTLRLRVAADDYLPTQLEVAGLPREDLRIGLLPRAQAAALTGRLVDERGDAVAGTRVVVTQPEPRLPTDAARPSVAELRSAADGSFHFDALPPGAAILHVLATSHADHRRRLELPERSTTDLGAIPLADFGWVTLTGVVRDLAGAPVAGAKLTRLGSVQLDRAQVKTAADGTFSLDRIPPGPLILPAAAAGVWELFELSVPDRRRHHVELVMPIGTHFVGGVVQIAAEPAAYLRVDGDVEGYRRTRYNTRTDAAGRFRIEGLPAARLNISVSRFDPSQSRDYPDLEADREDHVLEFPALPEPLIFRGHVRDPSGAAVVAAVVHATDGGTPTVQGRSGIDGGFELRLRALAPGRVRLGASHPEHRAVVDVVSVPPRAETVTHDLVLSPLGETGSVTGTVRDARGQLVAGAFCVVVVAGPGGDEVSVSVRTDGIGAFRCDLVPVGDGRLRVVADGHPRHLVPVTVRSGAVLVVDVVFPEIERVALPVIVRDAAGEPVPGAYVAAFDPHDVQLGLAVTDASGRVTLEGVPRIALRLMASTRESLTCLVDLPVARVGGAEIALEIPGGPHRLEGLLRSADGVPVGTVPVSVRGIEHQGSRVFDDVYPDADGRFAVDGLPAGRYLLTVRTDDPVEAEVWVPGERVELRLRR